MRLFIAIELSPDIRSGLSDLQNVLQRQGRGVRWVNVSGIHCTLKFLGEVDEEKVPRLVEKLSGITTPPFELSVRRLGVFPGWRSPRVVWVGVETASPHLVVLQRRIERAVAPLGFPPEKRSFKPHLTLGRVRQKDGLDPLVHYLREHHDRVDLGEFKVDGYVLFQSILRTSGAEYRSIHHFPLKGESS
jgi:2'-5' RNA ligase